MKKQLVLLATLLLIVSCTCNNDPVKERSVRVQHNRHTITIGIAAPWSQFDSMERGIQLAAAEINAEGGILGRTIILDKRDDSGSVSRGQIVAQQFVDNPDMAAVIGHYNSSVTLSAATLYEYYGMLMIAPYATTPRLTRQGFKRIFRSVPNDIAYSTRLAGFCSEQNFKNIVIYQCDDEYGNGLANAFEKECLQKGIAVLDRQAFSSLCSKRIYREDFAVWKNNFQFDAVFLAGVLPQAAEIICALRESGIIVPVIGGDGLDTPDLLRLAQGAAEGTYVASTFHYQQNAPAVQKFTDTFIKKFAVAPTPYQALGYDAVRLLAQAARLSRFVVPDSIASGLRLIRDFPGVTGTFTWNENGEMAKTDAIIIKTVKNGRFELFSKVPQ